jgi:methionyl-tRNA formyltransferase
VSDAVVLLSPNLYGDYAICVAELLARRGVRTEAIFVRRLASLKRLRHELRAEGPAGFARKVARKLLFRRMAHVGADHDTIAELKQREGIPFRSLRDFAQARGAEIRFCRDLNDDSVRDEIGRLAPAAVVFAGGGLLRRPLLEACRHRIIGCHPGILPEYRGMDCLEWAVLEGQRDKLGLTTFLIDEGVDTGPILRLYPVAIEETDGSFEKLRARLEPMMCRAMAETVAEVVAGTLVPRPQARSDGRQFFVMHRAVRQAADAALRQGMQS